MAKFEWDENKDQKNLEKHGISFEDASDIFNDPDRLIFSQERQGEKRYLTIGKAYEAIISIIYTTRDLVYRIISARRASKEERRAYLTKKLSKNQEDEN
jgi:uncharacterized DUF497 family protein